jgi:hypothetical protein
MGILDSSFSSGWYFITAIISMHPVVDVVVQITVLTFTSVQRSGVEICPFWENVSNVNRMSQQFH